MPIRTARPAVRMAPEHVRRGDTVVSLGRVYHSEPRSGSPTFWFLGMDDDILVVDLPFIRVSSNSVEVSRDARILVIPGPRHA